MSGVAEMFEKKPDLEKSQSVARLIYLIIFIVYSAAMYVAGWKAEVLSTLPAMGLYLTFCVAYVVATTISPTYSAKRCLWSIPFDQLGMAYLIGSSGWLGAPFIFTPAVSSVGTGLRYGTNFGFYSSAVSGLCLGLTMYFSSFWQEHFIISLGILLGVVLLPVYANALSIRLTKGKREMEKRVGEMEAVAVENQKQLRQRQSELAHVARLSTMGEMTSGIAHEINQPLAAILSYNQASIRMLRDNDSQTEEIIRAMSMAAEQSKRASEIIKRLRAFAKKQTSINVRVNLNDVIANSLVLIEHGLKDNQISIQTNFSAQLPLVDAESIQLEQVVLNLIRNAMDSMTEKVPKDRTIQIKTSFNESLVITEITDNGTGIPSELLPQLFHPFFTTKEEGMGLGLTISQSIIEAFDGAIEAKNTPDGGAVFKFTLPIYKN